MLLLLIFNDSFCRLYDSIKAQELYRKAGDYMLERTLIVTIKC